MASIIDYYDSLKITQLTTELPGNAFNALVFALLRECGSEELRKLEIYAFPELVAEFRQRYNAPGGVIHDGEWNYARNQGG